MWGALIGMASQASSSESGGLSFIPGFNEFTSIHGAEMQRNDMIQNMADARQHNFDMFGLQSKFNAKEAKKGRDFAERMSNTQMQRSIKDMERAGLNPLIALGGGNTPSSPTASAGGSSSYTSSASNISEGLGSGAQDVIGKAIAMKKMKKELDILDSTNNQIKANTRKTNKEGNVLEKEENKTDIINNFLRPLSEMSQSVSDKWDFMKRRKKHDLDWDEKMRKKYDKVKIGGPK